MKAKLVSKETERMILERFYYQGGKLLYKEDYNRCKANTEAGVSCLRGYKRVSINYKKFLVHRVIWFLHHKTWPEYLDHINQDKTDNRIENLRPCSFSENKRNVDYGKSAGIRRLKSGNWEAATHMKGDYKYLGTFETEEEARVFREGFLKSLYGEFHYDPS